jgi:hypothetical protein
MHFLICLLLILLCLHLFVRLPRPVISGVLRFLLWGTVALVVLGLCGVGWLAWYTAWEKTHPFVPRFSNTGELQHWIYDYAPKIKVATPSDMEQFNEYVKSGGSVEELFKKVSFEDQLAISLAQDPNLFLDFPNWYQAAFNQSLFGSAGQSFYSYATAILLWFGALLISALAGRRWIAAAFRRRPKGEWVGDPARPS